MKEARRYLRFPQWDDYIDFEEYKKALAEEIKYRCKKYNLTEVRELEHHELRRMFPYMPLRDLVEIRVFELKGCVYE